MALLEKRTFKEKKKFALLDVRLIILIAGYEIKKEKKTGRNKLNHMKAKVRRKS